MRRGAEVFIHALEPETPVDPAAETRFVPAAEKEDAAGSWIVLKDEGSYVTVYRDGEIKSVRSDTLEEVIS